MDTEWMARMNAAVDYIEANLAGEIDMGMAASKACCSEYHFTRIFSFIANLPLSEYIRRRRLTMAGFELQKSNAKVIDVANRYGYDSPNSFARAFQSVHGINPSEARLPGVTLKSFARLHFVMTVKASAVLDYRIVAEGEVTVFGKSTAVPHETAYEDIPAFIDRCEAERVTNKIVAAGHGDAKTLLKSVIWDADNGMVNYMLCLDMPPEGVPDEFERMTIPARTWVAFPLVIERPGEDSIISIWKRIWTEWFPNSGYEQDSGPHQERCYWREDGKMIVEAWVPVIPSRH